VPSSRRSWTSISAYRPHEGPQPLPPRSPLSGPILAPIDPLRYPAPRHHGQGVQATSTSGRASSPSNHAWRAWDWPMAFNEDEDGAQEQEGAIVRPRPR
jgi:hypothetical protein